MGNSRMRFTDCFGPTPVTVLSRSISQEHVSIVRRFSVIRVKDGLRRRLAKRSIRLVVCTRDVRSEENRSRRGNGF